VRPDLARDPSEELSRPGRSLRAVPAGVWVERSALIERLTDTKARLILVEAPAGYGKTILVGQWRARMAQARPFGWISLDEDDNEPRRLWRYITQALLRACPELDAEQILGYLAGNSPDITGAADAAEILALLERDNAFIVPLDQSRQWFRYHHLLAEVLQDELGRTEPGIVPVLHGRASAWYQRSGSAEDAIDHAIAAGDRAGAIDLIASHWYPSVASGRTATVRGWVRRLGDRAISADPVAAHCAAWSAAASGDRQSVRRWLPVMRASTREGPLPDGMRSIESSVALLQAWCGFDGLEPMSESAERAAKLEDDPSSPWYALARTALGYSRYLSGDPAGAEKLLLEAVASEALTSAMRLLSLSILSLTRSELGQPIRAQRDSDLAISLMTSGHLGQTPSAPLAHAAAGAVHAGLGRLHEARNELERALRVRRRVPGISTWATIDIMLLLSQVLIDLGDRSSATALAGEVSLLLAAAPGDAHPLYARLEELERRLDRTSPALLMPACPLTEREVTVLRLLRSALPRHEIAAALDVSENTIKTQVKSIYRKLGVSARRDAIARGQQLGIL
jgi:LuxR family transcriptional regulator, maltose regulon positive regulatory protein